MKNDTLKTPLVDTQDESTDKTAITPKTTINTKLFLAFKYLTCASVAVPTSILNALGAIASKHDNLADINSAAQFTQFISKHLNPENVFIFFSVFTLSNVVLFFLNQRYLFPAVKSATNLIVQLGYNTYTKLQNKVIEAKDGINPAHIGLFVWSFATCLIFGALGAKAMSFLGPFGEGLGFTLSMTVYFSTRYMSTIFTVQNLKNPQQKQRQLLLDRLLTYNLTKFTHSENVQKHPENAINQWLSELFHQQGDRWRQLLLGPASKASSLALLALFTPVVLVAFLPEAVQGLELLLHIDINQGSAYQNAASIGFGATATSLTAIFYGIAISKLPKQFFITALNVFDNLGNDNSAAVKQLGLTAIAFFASYVTGLGFRFAASSAVHSGHLSYLGDTVSHIIPDLQLGAVTMMLWSHLQELINQPSQIELDQTQTVDSKSIKSIVTNPALADSTLALFGQSHITTGDGYTQINDSGADADQALEQNNSV